MALNNGFLKALAYSDVFDYPLSRDEIYLYYIGSNPISKKTLLDFLGSQENKFVKNENLYCLKDREVLFKLRKEREIHSKKKLDLAKKICWYLSKIPTINFIGISGSLSMLNADEDEDIDLVIICSNNSIWSTRFFCILITSLLGRRRKKNDKYVRDKICLNLFLEEKSISFAKKIGDIYIAHEIVQVLPVFSRNNTYLKFLNENIWVSRYLPHAFAECLIRKPFMQERSKADVFYKFLKSKFVLKFARLIQTFFINKENVSDSRLEFHPKDTSKYVLEKYNKNLELLRITKYE